ncbi:hypothetical protein ACFFWC_11850 [Plantactinospora siamensis]|uniref:hypothetical protein n=1 Tax=Plantactinospora siamensis TaxID=555372 RepID=UPI0035E9B7EE
MVSVTAATPLCRAGTRRRHPARRVRIFDRAGATGGRSAAALAGRGAAGSAGSGRRGNAGRPGRLLDRPARLADGIRRPVDGAVRPVGPIGCGRDEGP